jgi:hypothetical protein
MLDSGVEEERSVATNARFDFLSWIFILGFVGAVYPTK